MKEILKKICSKTPSKIDKEFLDEICQDIDDYYNNSDIGRHSYADVSSYIYETESGDYEYLIENLQKIYDYYKSKNNIEGQKRIFKLIDHIRLECNRADGITSTYLTEVSQELSQAVQMRLVSFMNSVESKEQELNQIIENQKHSMKNEFKKQTDEIDKINSNLISVLGIFGAIIVAFFGGLNLLGSIMNNMGSVSSYRLAFMTVVCLQGLFNIIFMLLHCISKLTGKKLWSSCKLNKSCSMHENKNNTIACLYEKYPMVIIYNVLSLWALINLYIMYIFDKYNLITNLLLLIFKSYGSISTIIVGMLLMSLLQIGLIKFARWNFNKFKSSCDCIRIEREDGSSDNSIQPAEIEIASEEEVE